MFSESERRAEIPAMPPAIPDNPPPAPSPSPIPFDGPLPELLAPAGDRECVKAAVENGADAIYFGVRGHNARARAANFGLDEIPAVMAELHRRGVKGFVTLNTLAFSNELPELETIVRELTLAGVDAVIVQDIGLVQLIRAITPDLEIHASTQMSITSAAGVRMARELGCARVVVARELSLAEIAKIRDDVGEFPLEVFVHGALCVAYSGQCLTSESLGGRSANRGACAQACRMPYQIVRDGVPLDLDHIKYLVSPRDLAAHDLIPELASLGVASLKIEGRLKSPEYVAHVTRHYRKALDALAEGRRARLDPEQTRELEMTFSRGFSHGFLEGVDHKRLVRGDYSKKRGVLLGEVVRVRGHRVVVDLQAPVKPGDGLVFDAVESEGAPEQGGRVYEVRPVESRSNPNPNPASTDRRGAVEGPAELAFGRGDLDPRLVRPGQRVWKTDDPELTRRIRQSYQGLPKTRVPIDIHLRARVGEPLALEARAPGRAPVRVLSPEPLAEALTSPATEAMIREQLDRLGETVYAMRGLTVDLDGRAIVPRSVLNSARRELAARLDEQGASPPSRTVAPHPVLPKLRAELFEGLRQALPDADPANDRPELVALCRSMAQVPAALAAAPAGLLLDFEDLRVYKEAVPLARDAGVPVHLATPRVEKPGEGNLFKYLLKAEPDGLLVRNAGGMAFCAERGVPWIADYSLNAANELTAAWLLRRGASRVTASYDLDVAQLLDLLRVLPPGAAEVVVHQHMPMFHMEHCVFCAFLSPGTDHTNCGRPCDRHDVRLRDRVGTDHPLKADVGCRNTLYNGVPQSAAEVLPAIVAAGARRLRVEFLDESPDRVRDTLRLYREALDGRRDPRALWRELRASNEYGVTRGALSIREGGLTAPRELVTLDVR